MKSIFHILLFCCFVAPAQNTAIQVFLTEVESGKVITDAKVTLEGYNLPDIQMQYDAKNKFYYVTIIPEGYNTVMAYHDKYNEKGFQNVQGLPAKLEIKMHDPRNVYYDFDKAVLWNLNAKYKKENAYYRKLEKLSDENKYDFHMPNFRNLYQEDPYHIAIISKLNVCEFFEDRIFLSLLDSLSLEYSESVFETTEGNFWKYCYGFDWMHGFFNGFEHQYKDKDKIICECYSNDFVSTYGVYFFNKKDKSKFKRFNSVEINQLRNMGYIVATITNLKLQYYGKKPFNADKFYNITNYNMPDYKMQPLNNNFRFENSVSQTVYNNAKDDLNNRYVGITYENSLNTGIEGVYFIIPDNIFTGLGLGALDIGKFTNMKTDNFFIDNYKGE